MASDSALARERARMQVVSAMAWRRTAYAAIALLPVVLSLPFLSEPMEQDEGVYFVMAMSGDLPYASVFDHKPPLVYAWYHLALLLNGGAPAIETVRLLAALHLSAAALGVCALGTMLYGQRAGMVAGFVMAAAVADQYLQFNANTEVFMLAPLTWSLVAFARGWRSNGLRWFALAGALAAAAALTKSVGVLHIAALAATLAWAVPMRLLDARAALRSGLALLAGAAAAGAAALTPFVASGHWGAFWHANVTYNRAYSSQIPFEDKLFAIAAVDERVLLAGLPLFVLAAAGTVTIVQRGASLASGLLVSGVVAACAGASATGREYAHYWVPLLPFAAILAAVTVERIAEGWRSTAHRLHAEALLLAMAIPAIFAIVPLYVLGVEDAHLRKYHDGVNARRALENDALAARIRALTSPRDAIFVLGDEAQLYALADRAPATYYPRAVSAIDTDDAALDRILAELRAAAPRLVVDSARVETGAALLGLAPQPVTLDLEPAVRAQFDALLRQHYRLEGQVAYADIWLRND